MPFVCSLTGKRSEAWVIPGRARVFFDNVVAELVYREGAANVDLEVRRALARAEALSADVNAALDPSYAEVSDKRNAARLGYGLSLTKYTGGARQGRCQRSQR